MRQLVGFILFSLCSLNLMAASWFGAEFSADLLLISPQQQTMQGRIYVSDQGVRTEYHQGERVMVEIIRPQQQRAWLLYPGEKRYIERPYPAASVEQEGNPCADFPWAECRQLAEETVNGRTAIKWSITSTQGESLGVQWIDKEHRFPVKYVVENQLVFERRYLGNEVVNGRDTQRWESVNVQPGGKRELSYQWYDAELNIAVRQQTADGYIRELTGIELGPVDDGLFELPQDYQRHDGGEAPVGQ